MLENSELVCFGIVQFKILNLVNYAFLQVSDSKYNFPLKKSQIICWTMTLN